MQWTAKHRTPPTETKLKTIRLLEKRGLQPYQPEYRSHRDDLMPIEVPIGRAAQKGSKRKQWSWLPGQEHNGFLMVTGGSGSGKTEALKAIGGSLARHGVPVVSIDFHGDMTFDGQVTMFLHLGRGDDDDLGINPLAVDFSMIPDGLEVKIANEVDRIGRASGGLGYKQAACLRKVLTNLYREFGIATGMPVGWSVRSPTLGDLSTALQKACASGLDGFDRQTLMACSARVDVFTCNAVFRKRRGITARELLACNVRLDCSRLGREAQLLAAETVLEMLFEAGKAAGPIPVDPRSDSERYRVFIMIDEAKILSLGRGKADDSRHILNKLATEGRKFGIGLILASQMTSHFGPEVHANVASRLVMKRMDPQEAKRVAPQLGLLPADLASMESPPGMAYFRSASTGGAVLLKVDKAPPVVQGVISEI